VQTRILVLAPGIILCVAVAIIARFFGDLVPVVGGPVFAIVIGMILASIRKPVRALIPGVQFSSKVLLQWSIVLLGANLSLAAIAHGGAGSLPVMLTTLVVTLAMAFFVGGLLGLDRDLRRLLGIGTSICGGSAIAALSSVIEADEHDIAYALGAVFLFNIVAVLIFPPIGHALHLSQAAFGLWAGTAINDTSSVVAAAFSYGHVAGSTAVIVKLTRTTLIVPIVAFYAWRRLSSTHDSERKVNWRSVIPWFIIWFLVAAALNSVGVIPANIHGALQQLALFSITVALAGVGLSSDYAKIKAAGLRPLLLGAVLWVTIAITSLVVASLAHLG
jgi:uncharacterized integral membrane protein (TIGR00698 family)